MKEIPITVSPGEFFDRLTILFIKQRNIKDPGKVAVVNTELKKYQEYLDLLENEADRSGFRYQLDRLHDDLYSTNERLWDIEDQLRLYERGSNFDSHFIELARGVYKTNDRRAALKREISDLFGATVYEVKEHVEY